MKVQINFCKIETQQTFNYHTNTLCPLDYLKLCNVVSIKCTMCSLYLWTITLTDFSPSNKSVLISHLIGSDWSELFQWSIAEIAFKMFSDKVYLLYMQSFPTETKTITSKQNEPWRTYSFKKCIKVKNKVYITLYKKPTLTSEIRSKAYKSIPH